MNSTPASRLPAVPEIDREVEGRAPTTPVRRSVYLRGLSQTFWWLWVGWLVSSLANFVFPFLAFFLTARGLTPVQAGLVVSTFGLGSILAGPSAGLLADRIGRKPTIILSLVGSAGAATTLTFLASPLTIGAVVFLFGFASQAVSAPFQAIVTDVVAPEWRPRAFDLAYWAKNVGATLSLLAGGFLASGGWAAPFLLDAATSAAFALVVHRRVPETRPPSSEGRGTSFGYGEVLADRRLVTLLLLHAALAVTLWQLHSGLPIDMASRTSPASFGAVLSVNTVLVAVLQPFSSHFTRRRVRTTVLAIAALLVGAGLGGYALCSTAWQYALASGVLTLGEIAYLPVIGVLVADLAPAHLRGRYAGALGLSFGLAGFVAPIIGSLIIQSKGAPTLWVSCLATCAIVAGGYAWLGRATGDGPRNAALGAAGDDDRR